MTKRLSGDAGGARPAAGAHGDRIVSSAELARLLGVSKSAITFMTREAGAPYDSRGWRWPEVVHWYIWREVARGR